MKKYKKANIKLLQVYEFILINHSVVKSGATKGLTKLIANNPPHLSLSPDIIDVFCHNLAAGAQRVFFKNYGYVSTLKRRLMVREIVGLLRFGMAKGYLATMEVAESDMPGERMKQLKKAEDFIQRLLDDVVEEIDEAVYQQYRKPKVINTAA